jgi:hypothetical protein
MFVKMQLYDFNGKRLRVLINEYKKAGNYDYLLDMNEHSSGAYFYVLSSDNNSITKKLVLIK